MMKQKEKTNEHCNQAWRCGQTGLAGGIRISKADLRVEAYGSVDELNTVLGFARSICKNEEIAGWTEQIQKTLFRLGSALATPSGKPQAAALHHRGRRRVPDPAGVPDRSHGGDPRRLVIARRAYRVGGL